MRMLATLLLLFASVGHAAEDDQAADKSNATPPSSSWAKDYLEHEKDEGSAAELPSQFKAAFKGYAQCRKAMKPALLRDPRYQSESPVDDATQKDFDARYGALADDARLCASAVVHAHTESVRDACKQHECGKHVLGGCAHISSYSITDAAIRQAVLTCEAK